MKKKRKAGRPRYKIRPVRFELKPLPKTVAYLKDIAESLQTHGKNPKEVALRAIEEKINRLLDEKQIQPRLDPQLVTPEKGQD